MTALKLWRLASEIGFNEGMPSAKGQSSTLKEQLLPAAWSNIGLVVCFCYNIGYRRAYTQYTLSIGSSIITVNLLGCDAHIHMQY